MKNTNFGFYNHGGVQYCKRCNHIIEFPSVKINSNAWQVDKLKRFNFRVIERNSWIEKSNRRPCGGKTENTWDESIRENIPSCMNCDNIRGTDCDEPWTEDQCEIHFCHFIAPFTICDLHGIRLRRIRVLDDGTVEGIPKYCYDDTWMSLEGVKKWNADYADRLRKDYEKRKKKREEELKQK